MVNAHKLLEKLGCEQIARDTFAHPDINLEFQIAKDAPLSVVLPLFHAAAVKQVHEDQQASMRKKEEALDAAAMHHVTKAFGWA